MKTTDTPSPAVTAGAREGTFETDDGTRLFYRRWEPALPSARCIILLHRGHEHSGRLEETAQALCADGASCFAYDARGHGRSPGRRGDAPSFATLVRDLDAFVRHVRTESEFEEQNIAVVANSVGGVVATAWVHDYAPRIRALVLIAPAFSIKLYVPFALAGLRALRKLRGNFFIKSYVRPSLLTRDDVEARRYAEDRLIARDISVNVLLGLDETSRRLVEDAAVIRTPTLVLSAGSDFVVRAAPQRAFVERLGAARKHFARFDGLRHALLHERSRRMVLATIQKFLDEVFSAPPVPEDSLLDGDRSGPTAVEFESLQRPAAPVRRFWFATQRLALKTAGRLSQGIRVGWRDGFDSGRSLDYIYENRARGAGPIGRIIDRVYLDTPGWRGIRQRRVLLESGLRDALESAGGAPVHVVDIAAGPGRYVLDVLEDFPNATGLLSDWSELNVHDARVGAAARGLDGVVVEQGDAFDESRLASMLPKADVVIVSGLYELFPDNARIVRSLRGITRLLNPGGRFIYTNQPTHPQLEMIARVLRNRDGRPWIMRRRSQAEMDALVRSVGLTKVRTTIDDQGVFTVSVAQKEAVK